MMQATSLAFAAVAAVSLASATAHGGGLSSAEVERLQRGDTVAREQTLSRGEDRYVGGVTYTMIDARVGEIERLLADVREWPRFLPRTREARQVGTASGDALVEVAHGSGLLQVRYTIRVHRVGNVVRFWMEPTRPHDILDVWGFFRADPSESNRTLCTYGILIDMGAGLLRDLFEKRVRELALTVPQRVRGLFLERRAAEVRESSLVTEAVASY
jgi:hypothetical protein